MIAADPGSPARPPLWSILPEILLFAAFVAVYSFGIHAFGMLTWDEAEYATLGRSTARGAGYTIGGTPNAHRLPLLPLVLAAAFRAGLPATDAAARAVAAAIAAGALSLVWWFVRREAGRGGAAVAAIVCGVAPAFWLRTTQVMTDVAFAGLFAGAVWSFRGALDTDSETGGRRRMRVAAFLAAAAFLTRYTAVLFLPVAVLLTGFAVLRTRSAWRRVASLPTAGAAVLALALIAPWFVRSAAVTGDPWSGLRWAAAQVPSYAPAVSHPWWFYLASLPAMFSLPALLFLIAGVIVAFVRRDRFCLDSLLAAAFLVGYFSLFRFKEDRFVLAIVPLLSPVVASGIRELARRVAGERDQWVAAGAALVVTVAACSGRVRPVLRNHVTNGFPALLQASAHLRASLPPGAVVLTAIEPQAAWYTGRRTLALPADAAALPSAARRASVALIVNFERGQPKYASALVEPAMRDARCAVQLFADGQFAAAVIPAECLRAPA